MLNESAVKVMNLKNPVGQIIRLLQQTHGDYRCD